MIISSCGKPSLVMKFCLAAHFDFLVHTFFYCTWRLQIKKKIDDIA